MKRKSLQHIVVAARFRPEPQESGHAIWQLCDSQNIVVSRGDTYKLDIVLPPEADNITVYNKVVYPIVLRFVDGFNGTLFCYGETDSGKTHTMFGTGEDVSVVELTFHHLFQDLSSKNIEDWGIAVSYFEVYNESVIDLLDPSKGELEVHEVHGEPFVAGLTTRFVSSTKQVLDILQTGSTNKHIMYDCWGNCSSQSHTVFRVYLGVVGSGVFTTNKIAELNFVELAGSEVPSRAAARQVPRMDLSLKTFQQVIHRLARQETPVPYGDSNLTRLLQHSFGGNSNTAIICCLRSSDYDSSRRSVSLGLCARNIATQASRNVFRKWGLKVNVKDRVAEEVFQEHLDEKAVPDPPPQMKISVMQITTCDGNVVTYVHEPAAGAASDSLVALTLHGRGLRCTAKDWAPLYAPLVAAGYRVYSPDMPGFGATPGAWPTSRTEQFHFPGGPLQLVMDIVNHICPNGQRLAIVGCDWGGSLALSLASTKSHKAQITALALYHPSWTDEETKLAAVKQPTLICWLAAHKTELDDDSPSGQTMAKIIPNSKLVLLSGGNKDKKDSVLLPGLSPGTRKQLTACLVDWIKEHQVACPFQSFSTSSSSLQLTIPDPEQDALTSSSESDAEEGAERSPFSFRKSLLVHLLLDPELRLSGRKRLSCSECTEAGLKPECPAFIPLVLPSPPPTCGAALKRWAVARFADLLRTGELSQFYSAFLGKRKRCELQSEAEFLFTALPRLDSTTEITDMWDLGIWPQPPQGTEMLHDFPRYPKGRQVLVKLPVEACMSLQDFGCYDPAQDGEYTYRGVVTDGCSAAHCAVLLPRAQNQGFYTAHVKWSDVYACNQPTEFPKVKGGLVLEDGITCDYSSCLLKAKMMEAALSVVPLVGQMDFMTLIEGLRRKSERRPLSPRETELAVLQVQCIARICGVLNITRHERAEPERFFLPDAGCLAVRGQWHDCGVPSVQAAFLHPFGHLLGWEIRYRRGFHVAQYRDAKAWNGRPRHTEDGSWLEVTLVPLMLSFVLDPGTSACEAQRIAVPYDEAYTLTGRRFPVASLKGSAPPRSLSKLARHCKDTLLPEDRERRWASVGPQWARSPPAAAEWVEVLREWPLPTGVCAAGPQTGGPRGSTARALGASGAATQPSGGSADPHASQSRHAASVSSTAPPPAGACSAATLVAGARSAPAEVTVAPALDAEARGMCGAAAEVGTAARPKAQAAEAYSVPSPPAQASVAAAHAALQPSADVRSSGEFNPVVPWEIFETVSGVPWTCVTSEEDLDALQSTSGGSALSPRDLSAVLLDSTAQTRAGTLSSRGSDAPLVGTPMPPSPCTTPPPAPPSQLHPVRSDSPLDQERAPSSSTIGSVRASSPNSIAAQTASLLSPDRIPRCGSDAWFDRMRKAGLDPDEATSPLAPDEILGVRFSPTDLRPQSPPSGG